MKHTHKYRRVNIGRDKPYFVYRCILARCEHYINENLIINRESICWSCNKSFIVKKKGKQKPICEDCHVRKYGKEESTEDILKRIGVIE